MSAQERLKIQEVIAHFSNSFDAKDWSGLEACLTESLYTDYGDLRGTPPETLRASEYVAARREALEHLKLHHLVGNYEIDLPDPGHATCRAAMIIWRRSATEQITSHCVYEFQLAKHEADWKISGVTQRVLWSEQDELS